MKADQLARQTLARLLPDAAFTEAVRLMEHQYEAWGDDIRQRPDAYRQALEDAQTTPDQWQLFDNFLAGLPTAEKFNDQTHRALLAVWKQSPASAAITREFLQLADAAGVVNIATGKAHTPAFDYWLWDIICTVIPEAEPDEDPTAWRSHNGNL